MLGKNGSYYGQFLATSLEGITVFALQKPCTSRLVPDMYFVNANTVKALVDFHEGNYSFPKQFGALAHEVMAADILGADTFNEFVAGVLKIPSNRLNLSHNSQELRKTIRDRLRLQRNVPVLEETRRDICYLCREGFLDEVPNLNVACCGRKFHRACLVDLYSCPFCKVAWGGLNCVKCGHYTVHQDEREPYLTYMERRNSRMACCGMDIHPQCKKSIAFCPDCGTGDWTWETFVYLRKKTRVNEAKRRAQKY